VFIGRDKELQILEKLYKSNKFEYLVMYGRRRIGKTEILKEFSKRHKTIFFSAVEKKSNLVDFSTLVFSFYNDNINASFESWEDAFCYIADHSTNDRTVLIIDEFPYIAKSEPIVKSVLQKVIDRLFIEKNIMLILCGSSVSFMVNNVMGKKTPLYGRNTAVMQILPFEYNEIGNFFPKYSKEEQMKVYSILGGIPYYLSKFKDDLSIRENISNVIIQDSGPLRDEPLTLLKSELREPATYNTILEAIANGNNKISEIASKTKIEVTKLPRYLNTLQEMKIIGKLICAGEKKNSKKTQYIIIDNFFSFWYSFVFSNTTKIELMEPMAFLQSIEQEIFTYYGHKFENICLQYLKNEAKANKLPFIPSILSKWWGGNKLTQKQDDIDILGIDKNKYLFCECKFKNEIFDLKEFNDVITISKNFKNAKDKYFYFFVKSDFSQRVIQESKNYNCKLITIKDM